MEMINGNKIFSIKRKDGKIFKIGDKFDYKGNTGKPIVKGKISKRKKRICGFEINEKDNAIYVLYMPQYANGEIEKKSTWRLCELENAIKL